LLPPQAHSGADEELRRLEARVVAGDLALQRQVETVLALAGRRAERTATWGAIGLVGAGALLVLGLSIAKRTDSRSRRSHMASFRGHEPAVRRSGLGWPIAAVGALWRLLPALRLVWRAVSDVGNELARARRRR
jgi:hypothetical protein